MLAELKKSPSTSNDKAGYDVESNWKGIKYNDDDYNNDNKNNIKKIYIYIYIYMYKTIKL